MLKLRPGVNEINTKIPMKKLVLLYCLFTGSISYGQTSNEVSYLKIYSLPLSMNTVIALSADDVRNFNSPFLQTFVISDSLGIENASPVKFLQGKKVYDDSSDVIDVRVVIDVYYCKGIRKSIVFDKSLNGCCLKEGVFYQKELNEWLKQYTRLHITQENLIESVRQN